MPYTIYTINNCPWCDKAEDLLADRDELYTKKNIEINETAKRNILDYLSKIQKRTTFPQVFCGDTYIGGYTDLEEYLKDV